MSSHRILSLLAATIFCAGCTSMTHADRRNLQAHGVDPALAGKMAHFAPLTLPEIVELSDREMLPEEIIQYLHATHHVYSLSDEDGYHLNSEGVNPTVIAYLFSTPDLMARWSDRTRFFDWSPYYVPTYGGTMNTFAEENYGSEKSYFAPTHGGRADATLQKQQSDQQKILGSEMEKQEKLQPQSSPALPPVQPSEPPEPAKPH